MQTRLIAGWCACALCWLVMAGARGATVVADAITGRITVESARYSARFDGGLLVYLHNKLKNRALIDVTLDPAIPIGYRTGLYVTDKLDGDPYWLYPATEGEHRAAVTVKALGGDGAVVTFKGLVAGQGAQVRPVPEAELTVTVAVAPQRGDLLVTTAGACPSKMVIGSAFAYAGLMTRSIDYAVEHSGIKSLYDFTKGDEKRRQGVLEWSNLSHDKRTGLGGFLWHAPVTVQAAMEDPQAAFAVWAEDDVPLYKLLAREGKGNAYVTYAIPPYDDNHTTTSVTWRVNVSDRGWTAAATPFADSLARRGMAANRASWAKDVSLVVFMPSLGSGYLDALLATFPPECRQRILLWLPQSWRTLTNTRDAKTHDAYYWDNNFSEKTAAEIKAATDAGFRVSVYTNPHYNWGSAEQVIDPEIRKVVAGFAQYPLVDTISRQPRKYGANNLAYTPYRAHMLNTFRQIFDKLDVSLYLDTTHQFMLDGRGRVDGRTSYEGALELFRGARTLKREQFLGTENLNELAVMGGGCDCALFFDLHWARGWEKAKAAHTHPIVGYLYRDVSLQVSQRVNPWSYGGARYYHQAEEISERIGTIATTEWTWQGKAPVATTPEEHHWLEKLQLYTKRGVRPVFPEQWDTGVMSYLKAADGALFVYEETPYGSRLVERSPKGPIVHSARAWKVNTLKTPDGGIDGWIGHTDDGAWIGLDSDGGGYALSPTAKPDPRLRIRSLPAGFYLKDVTVTDAIVTLRVAPLASTDRAKTPAGPMMVAVGFASPRPVERVAVPGRPRLPIRAGVVEVPENTPIAFILKEGVIAPFEYGGTFSLPLPATLGLAGKGEIWHLFGGWDQKWNAPVIGPVNPRPGTVYRVSFDAAKMGEKDAPLTGFLTSGGTRSSGIFKERGGVTLTSLTPQRVTLAGVRNTSMAVAWDHTLGLRLYGEGKVTNLSALDLIRPELSVSDTAAIDLGTVTPGQPSAPSPERRIANGQPATVAIGETIWRSVLYGTAHVTAPADKPYLQTIDDVGAVLIGTEAARFAFAGGGQALKLLGADGQPGLEGGETPETERLAVRFLGADKPGVYTATLRIVTQAANLGILSTGKAGDPLAGLYYVEIPVRVQVKGEG
jgi:hypothetical protein